MLLNHPKRLLVTAVVLMVFGVVMPLLMVIKMVESTFFLNFLSYGSSTLGFFLGVISVAASRLKQEKKDNDKKDYK
jgi:putative Mn2+ efflux pump MntP